MKQRLVEVIANAEVMPDVFLLHLKAPEIAEHAVPGQFVHLSCNDASDPLLRRPLSLHRIGKANSAWRDARRHSIAGERGIPLTKAWRPGPGEISVLFARVGKGTTLFSKSNPGDRLSALGPLGNGFKFETKTRNVLLVAGGIGIAPLIALADEAIEREMTVTLVAGARNERLVLPAEMLPPEVEYVVCTDDGSKGRRGVVTSVVPELIDWADQVFACGPKPMLQALAALRLTRAKSVQVALEEHMACGVGACLGCVVRTRKGLQRVCRDGPVFKIGDIEWW